MIKLKVEIEYKDGTLAINFNDNYDDPNRPTHTLLEGLVANLFIRGMREKYKQIQGMVEKHGGKVDYQRTKK